MGSSAPLGSKNLFNTPGANLPGFIRELAREFMKKGKSKSQAIQMAIGVCQRWAKGGENVKPETRAKAAAAIAQWNAARAKAKATPNKKEK